MCTASSGPVTSSFPPRHEVSRVLLLRDTPGQCWHLCHSHRTVCSWNFNRLSIRRYTYKCAWGTMHADPGLTSHLITSCWRRYPIICCMVVGDLLLRCSGRPGARFTGGFTGEKHYVLTRFKRTHGSKGKNHSLSSLCHFALDLCQLRILAGGSVDHIVCHSTLDCVVKLYQSLLF